MINGWIDKTWWFLDEKSKPAFVVIIEYPKDKTPPEELVKLIELYQQGYRVKKQ